MANEPTKTTSDPAKPRFGLQLSAIKNPLALNGGNVARSAPCCAES
jgi:hypothetical protein